MEQQQMKRQTAFKVRVADLRNGEYVQQEGWNPNYIRVHDKEVSRANIMGVIVDKDESMMLDDGTGRITLRVFDDDAVMRNADIGDAVLVVGRPREYGGEVYVIPEIIRKVSKDWLEVRQKELEDVPILAPVESEVEPSTIETPSAEPQTPQEQKIEVETIGAAEPAAEEPSEKTRNPAELTIELIKEIDQGDGADIEEVIEKSGIEDCEDMIKKLVMNGDVFELKPGRIKVLE